MRVGFNFRSNNRTSAQRIVTRIGEGCIFYICSVQIILRCIQDNQGHLMQLHQRLTADLAHIEHLQGGNSRMMQALL